MKVKDEKKYSEKLKSNCHVKLLISYLLQLINIIIVGLEKYLYTYYH